MMQPLTFTYSSPLHVHRVETRTEAHILREICYHWNSQMVFYLQLVGDKEHRLAFGNTPDSFMEDMRTHTSIHCAQRVVQEKYGPLTVEGTSQTHSLTLPSAQVGPSLTNLQWKVEK